MECLLLWRSSIKTLLVHRSFRPTATVRQTRIYKTRLGVIVFDSGSVFKYGDGWRNKNEPQPAVRWRAADRRPIEVRSRELAKESMKSDSLFLIKTTWVCKETLQLLVCGTRLDTDLVHGGSLPVVIGNHSARWCERMKITVSRWKNSRWRVTVSY